MTQTNFIRFGEHGSLALPPSRILCRYWLLDGCWMLDVPLWPVFASVARFCRRLRQDAGLSAGRQQGCCNALQSPVLSLAVQKQTGFLVRFPLSAFRTLFPPGSAGVSPASIFQPDAGETPALPGFLK
jgi:hypothetical protein